jgi:hypothetical protein
MIFIEYCLGCREMRSNRAQEKSNHGVDVLYGGFLAVTSALGIYIGIVGYIHNTDSVYLSNLHAPSCCPTSSSGEAHPVVVKQGFLLGILCRQTSYRMQSLSILMDYSLTASIGKQANTTYHIDSGHLTRQEYFRIR